jgi:membrane-associated phospholipid phosphatase
MRERNKKSALILGVTGYWMAGYFATNQLLTTRTYYTLSTVIDEAIPFKPGWLYIYLAIWIVIFSPLAVIKNYQQLKRTVTGYAFLFSVSFLMFILFPVKMARPEPAGSGLTLWGMSTLYQIDGAGNCFPSIHVAAILFGTLTSLRLNRPFGIFLLIWAFLISLSALFIKQHYLVDILAGLILALITYLIFIHKSPLFLKHKELNC